MYDTLDTLRDLASQLGVVVADTFGRAEVRGMSDEELLAVMDAAGSVLRGAQALIAETAGEVENRSDSPERSERLTTRMGCRNTRELVERITRMSGRSAVECVRAGRATAVSWSLISGEMLPAAYPAMRTALADGAVGVDGVVAVSSVLDEATTTREHRDAADEELAAASRGEGVDGGGLPTADDLRGQAQVWAAYLDPDGAEPREKIAEQQRGFTIGRLRNGVHPFYGNLLPEAAGMLTRDMDAILNPHAAGGPMFVDTLDPEQGEAYDPRTPKQKRHDALATIVSAAARSGELPTIGGAAPTLLVSVREDDLVNNTGVAHIDGIDEPVPVSVARHVACMGGVFRTTFDQNGRIEKIETLDRVFNAHQRKAITLRDGECIIPGCHVPAAWCEIHHVTEHSRGGPTSTDNGVLLCWHHHRTLDTSGWHIRMRHGIPEVQGPPWWDPSGKWRPITKSPTRMRDRLDTRMRQ